MTGRADDWPTMTQAEMRWRLRAIADRHRRCDHDPRDCYEGGRCCEECGGRTRWPCWTHRLARRGASARERKDDRHGR